MPQLPDGSPLGNFIEQKLLANLLPKKCSSNSNGASPSKHCFFRSLLISVTENDNRISDSHWPVTKLAFPAKQFLSFSWCPSWLFVYGKMGMKIGILENSPKKLDTLGNLFFWSGYTATFSSISISLTSEPATQLGFGLAELAWSWWLAV